MITVAQFKLKLDHHKHDSSYCSSCGEEIFSSRILICASCLNDECDKFKDLFKDIEESDYAGLSSREE